MSHRGGTCSRTASDEEWNFFIQIWRHFYLYHAPSWLPHPVNPNRLFLYHKTTHLLHKLSLHPIASRPLIPRYHPHRNGWSVQMMAVQLKFPPGWGRQRSDTVFLVRMGWTLTLRMILWLFTSLALSLGQKRISERVWFARRWKGSHWLLKRGSKASQSPNVCSHSVNFLTTCPARTQPWVLLQRISELAHWWKTGWQTRRESRWTGEAGCAESVP